MKQITEEFIRAHPECQDVRRALDLVPLLIEGEDLGSLTEVLTFTALVEHEYEVLVWYQFKLRDH